MPAHIRALLLMHQMIQCLKHIPEAWLLPGLYHLCFQCGLLEDLPSPFLHATSNNDDVMMLSYPLTFEYQVAKMHHRSNQLPDVSHLFLSEVEHFHGSPNDSKVLLVSNGSVVLVICAVTFHTVSLCHPKMFRHQK